MPNLKAYPIHIIHELSFYWSLLTKCLLVNMGKTGSNDQNQKNMFGLYD